VRTGPKPLVNERDYVPRTLEEARQLFDALTALDKMTRGQARSIVGTLQTLPERYTPAFSVQVVGYRKILARIGRPPWDDDSEKLPCISSERAA
jgi:hypothetical protein